MDTSCFGCNRPDCRACTLRRIAEDGDLLMCFLDTLGAGPALHEVAPTEWAVGHELVCHEDPRIQALGCKLVVDLLVKHPGIIQTALQQFQEEVDKVAPALPC